MNNIISLADVYRYLPRIVGRRSALDEVEAGGEGDAGRVEDRKPSRRCA
jgi:hypothetical protein